MKLLRNPIAVGILALLAVVLVFRNALGPLWQRMAHHSAPAKTPAPAVVDAPATPTASPTPSLEVVVPPVSKPPRILPESNIDMAQVGWKTNGMPRRDPFQLLPSTNIFRLYPPASDFLTLRAVWWQSGAILASVNNRVVHEGDVIYGTNSSVAFTVTRIGAERIWVDGPGGTEELIFDPAASLRGVTVRLGTDLNNSFAAPKNHLDWPFRVVNGQTNDVGQTPGWDSFSGTVLQKLEEGKYLVQSGANDSVVILKSVPLDLVDDDPLPRIRCKYVGTETYVDGKNLKRTARVYDFGQPCVPPAAVVQDLRARKALLVEQFNDVVGRHVQFEMAEAKKGNASAQYMLGRRCLYGDGVPKDEQGARRWFEASAAQGNTDAQAILRSLVSRQ